MKTSTLIDVNAAKLQKLLDHNREPSDSPDLVDELIGISLFIGESYYPALKHARAFAESVRRYYGPDSANLDSESRKELVLKMRTDVVKIAAESTRCRMDND
ncbi:hypothetical protein PPH41_00465 [Burkholderia gladioli]|nr:hypothetical protein [Burkholderia gladioli]